MSKIVPFIEAAQAIDKLDSCHNLHANVKMLEQENLEMKEQANLYIKKLSEKEQAYQTLEKSFNNNLDVALKQKEFYEQCCIDMDKLEQEHVAVIKELNETIKLLQELTYWQSSMLSDHETKIAKLEKQLGFKNQILDKYKKLLSGFNK